ncbi:O-acyltransferase WSD1-like [Cucumis melo var. makuwa]|uniref:O-acyltransferase WSD1-like n=1 Tax=Cucumis melo var. makuwa TaxID=1194695 RepID=A0A5A7SLE1_CUCMM|nr:O-acyltransferase WSD1-like [Cucumis melo var. makuwa]TYK06993.1 O-acyltransferase WSD1-like [Cucumis melo var. makuwa]
MEEEDELLEPVSPTAQCFNTSALSISVIAVVEFEIPIDEAKIMCYAKDFIPLNPLFSSIMTVNDVVVGMLFLGIRLYMEETRPESTKSNSTALVLLNTRMFRTYKCMEDMLNPNSNTPWGNRFAFLHIDIPKLTDFNLSNPLQLVEAAQKLIKRKRDSSAVFLVDKLMQMIHKFRGSEVYPNIIYIYIYIVLSSKYVYKTIKNSSLSISNLIGPKEKMALTGHPAKGMYFTVVGIPQSLKISVISYMENLRIAFGGEKEFIDQEKLTSCMKKAFDYIHKASIDVSI